MQDESGSVRQIPREARESFSLGQRCALLLINCISLAHLSIVGSCFLLPIDYRLQLSLALVALFVLPPLLSRIVLTALPFSRTRIDITSVHFFVWWAIFNLQGVFNRVTFLEEILRIVPGVYSAWLRLWGSRIGRFTYWTPGIRILDRSFLSVGDDVHFGVDVRLNPHVIHRCQGGKLELILDTITLRDRAFVGGYSLLTAGCEIGEGENARAHTVLPPFSIFKNGARIKPIEQTSGGTNSEN